MDATRNCNAEYRIFLTLDDVAKLEKTGKLTGEMISWDDGMVTNTKPLNIFYFKSKEDAMSKATARAKNKKIRQKVYDIYLTDLSLQKIKKREVAYLGDTYTPTYLRQGFISLEDVL